MKIKQLMASTMGVGALFFAPAQAEIQTVVAKWIPFQYDIPSCTASCGEQVVKQMNKINGVATVQLDLAGGKVNLTWKPGVPFSYAALDAGLRLAGPGINEVHVKAQGAITHNKDSVTLVSTGDGTRFILLGPLLAKPNQYVVEFNTASYPLPQSMRQQLIDAEQNHQYVAIDGKLLLPEQSPPLYLIIEHMQVAQPGT